MQLSPKGPDILSKGERTVREKWEEYAKSRKKESRKRKNIHVGLGLQTGKVPEKESLLFSWMLLPDPRGTKPLIIEVWIGVLPAGDECDHT